MNQPKITSFTPQNLRQLETDLAAAVAKVSADYGIPISFTGSRSFTQSGWSGKVEVALSSKVIVDKQDSINRQCIKMFNLPENVMNMVFSDRGKTFSIVKFQPNKPKNACTLTGNLMCSPTVISRLIQQGKYTINGVTGQSALTPAVLGEFRSLANQLSPENLHCDGEISASAARAKAVQLKKQWAALEQQVGRKVSESEIY